MCYNININLLTGGQKNMEIVIMDIMKVSIFASVFLIMGILYIHNDEKK